MIHREDPFENKRCLKTISSDESNLYTKHFGAVYSATVSWFYCSCDLLSRVLQEAWSQLYGSLIYLPEPENWILLQAANCDDLWCNDKKLVIIGTNNGSRVKIIAVISVANKRCNPLCPSQSYWLSSIYHELEFLPCSKKDATISFQYP